MLVILDFTHVFCEHLLFLCCASAPNMSRSRSGKRVAPAEANNVVAKRGVFSVYLLWCGC